MITQQDKSTSSNGQPALKRQGYQSYLLRLWRVNGEPVTWRATLEDPQTGESRAFARLDDLCAYLMSL